MTGTATATKVQKGWYIDKDLLRRYSVACKEMDLREHSQIMELIRAFVEKNPPRAYSLGPAAEKSIA